MDGCWVLAVGRGGQLELRCSAYLEELVVGERRDKDVASGGHPVHTHTQGSESQGQLAPLFPSLPSTYIIPSGLRNFSLACSTESIFMTRVVREGGGGEGQAPGCRPTRKRAPYHALTHQQRTHPLTNNHVHLFLKFLKNLMRRQSLSRRERRNRGG